MEQSNQLGSNRTGIDMSPQHSKAMIQDAEKLTPGAERDGQAIAELHVEYIREADRLGSIPMPGTVKGAVKSGMKKMTGRNPGILINKLGERLAFERSGVRLYEGMIAKCKASGGAGTPVSLERLQHFCGEEAQHFFMVKEVMEQLGCDPTAQTPDADVIGVATMGVQKVITDPRTTLMQCVDVLLAVELTDHAGWEILIKLADEAGLDDASKRFRKALKQEEEHLRQVREWCERGTLGQA